VGAVLAAVIYMYNPWSVSHLWPYFGYPAYAVLPLVFWLLVLSYMLFHLVVHRFRGATVLSTLRVLVVSGAVYAVLAASWVFPYMYSQLANKPFLPSYMPSLSRNMLDALSANNSIANNLRFLSGWGMPVNPQGIGGFWSALAFALPVLALAGLLVIWKKNKRNRYVAYWGLVFAAAVLLATGTASVLRGAYSYMVLHAPLTAGWSTCRSSTPC
jgi:hypothetical protein